MLHWLIILIAIVLIVVDILVVTPGALKEVPVDIPDREIPVDVPPMRAAVPVEVHALAVRQRNVQRGSPAGGPAEPIAYRGDSSTVPLHYDRDEGALVIDIAVGRTPVALVVDTGSADFTVKGSDCEWERCSKSRREARKVAGGDDRRVIQRGAHEFCVLQPCPCGRDPRTGKMRVNCSDHSYSPSKEARLAGGRKTLAYGSQTNRTRVYEEKFGLTIAAPGYEPLLVHQIHHVNGDTNSNIAGFAVHMNEQSIGSARGSLLQAMRTPAFTLNISHNLQGSTCRFGSMVVPRDALTLPMIDMHGPLGAGLRDSGVAFYACEMTGLQVDGGTVWTAEQGCPRIAWFDTGTTNTYADSRTCGVLTRMLGWSDGHSLTIHFPNGRIAWSANQMRDIDQPRRSALHVDDRAIPNIEDMFGGSRFIMIGLAMMVGRSWHHDLQNRRLSVW